jgi:hypothetical protein
MGRVQSVREEAEREPRKMSIKKIRVLTMSEKSRRKEEKMKKRLVGNPESVTAHQRDPHPDTRPTSGEA